MFTSFVGSCTAEGNDTQEIQITVRGEWFISLNPDGRVSIVSLTDSDARAMASTGAKAIDFMRYRRYFLKAKSLKGSGRTKIRYWEDGKPHQIVVKAEILNNLLDSVDGKWLYLSDRLKKLLKVKPVVPSCQQLPDKRNENALKKVGMPKHEKNTHCFGKGEKLKKNEGLRAGKNVKKPIEEKLLRKIRKALLRGQRL